MMEKDNIEELFREQAKKLEEKPEEQVWQKLEKQLHPKKEIHWTNFKDSVWFSAAVYALIAVPIFVLYFIEKGNSSSEIETMIVSNVESSPEKGPQKGQQAEGVDKIELTKKEETFKKELAKNSVEKAPIKTQQKIEDTGEVEKDGIAISEENQPILAANLDENKMSDEEIEHPKAVASANQFDEVRTTKMASQRVEIQKEEQEVEHKNQKIEQVKEKEDVVFLPDQFLVLDSIFKVNFRIKEKTPNQLLFKNKEVELRFRKDEKDSIVIESNDQINPTIKEKIEKRKKDIFRWYEK